jgi:hypothetical protein
VERWNEQHETAEEVEIAIIHIRHRVCRISRRGSNDRNQEAEERADTT